MDLSALRPIRTAQQFELAVMNMIRDKFQDWRKFSVIEERRLYTPQTVEYIWEQNKGMRPHVCEVYYDGEFVCDVTSKMQPDEALALIQARLISLMERIAKK